MKSIARLLVAALAGGAVLYLPACTTKSVEAEEQVIEVADLSAEAIQEAVSKVKPALVRIKVVEPSYWDGRESKNVGFGSGTIIHPDGYIITNHHVAGKAVQLQVTMPNREEVRARLIGTDPATDIAVIKLEPDEPMEYFVAEFGDSDSMEVGDPVMALGSPLSLSQSVTLGILSNLEMITPPAMRSSGDFELDGENVGELVLWFGHDAAIYPGNSGGPLINLEGKIVGINEIGMGLGGAIRGNLAKRVAEDLIERGQVRRAYHGITLQPLLKSTESEQGALIGSVMKESPAEKAGIKAGDVLLSVNGTAVNGPFLEDLPRINMLLADLAVGENATLTVSRNGERKDITVQPEQREPAVLPTKELKEWGLTARNLSRRAEIELALDSAHGVLITSTRGGGPATKAKPELRAKDVLTAVNGEKVQSLEQLREITDKLVQGATNYVPALVEFERDGERLFTVVEIGIDKLQDPAKDVEKAWLSMETQVLTREIAKQLGIPEVQGVRVTRVYDTAPEGFPIKVGDILTEFDEMPIEASRPVDADVFETMVRQYRIGMDVPVKLLRDKAEQKVTVNLGGSPEKIREMPRYKNNEFEFTVRKATFEDRTKPTLQDVEFDVIIDGVTSGGWADLAGLQVGDALLSINNTKISGIDQVEQIMEQAVENKVRHVVFFVRRGAQSQFLEMEPNWQ
jgi:serine protease Do